MSYFEVLGLNKEPFSISPDPAFFYRSAAHTSALERLEIAIRMKRGLSLILGDVGTGKTTMGRVLAQSFSAEPEFDFHLILNPLFQSEFQFLESLCKMFEVASPIRSTMDCLEALQERLYQKGVMEGKTTVLLIDEGQNLGSSLIEVLRSLLNYETNEYKLLQLVVMAQLEALPKFQRIKNFMDRANLKYVINTFSEGDCRNMIQFRLEKAGLKSGANLFTDDALRLIHRETGGYPRKINFLCQKTLEALVMEGKKVVDESLARVLSEKETIWKDEEAKAI